jgi:hypothetical protein
MLIRNSPEKISYTNSLKRNNKKADHNICPLNTKHFYHEAVISKQLYELLC